MIREYYSLIDSGILVSVPERTKTEPKDRGRARRTRPRLIHDLLDVWWRRRFLNVHSTSRNRLSLFFSQFTRTRFTLIFVHIKALLNVLSDFRPHIAMLRHHCKRKACPEGCQDDGKSHSDSLNLSLWTP